MTDRDIPGLLSVEELWAGTQEAILRDPFEEEGLNSWKDDAGTAFREVYLTSRKIEGEPIRVYAIGGLPRAEKPLPGILHIHGGGQTASLDWVKYWTSQGYAALSFDYGGEAQGRDKITRYPERLAYCNQPICNQFACCPDARSNCWYEWTYMARRMLTYLAGWTGVDPDRIGVFGISMGGTLTWKVAGIDHRVWAAAPIYGVGYDYLYHRRNPYAPAEEPAFPEDFLRYIAGITSEAYAPFIRCPVLFLSASNDFHGNFDWAGFTCAALPPDTVRYLSVAPQYNHHIFHEQADMLRLFMGAVLCGDNVFPDSPRLTAEKGSDGSPLLVLRVDESRAVDSVRLYVGLHEGSAPRRYWEERCPEKTDTGTYTASVSVLDPTHSLFAYACVRYREGYYLSTPVLHVIPQDIGCHAALAKTQRVIYEAWEGIAGWGTFSIGTDPLPAQLYAPIVPADGGGLTVARVGVIPWTHRLYDPRFAAPSDTALLKITCAGIPAKITVSLQDVYPLDTTPYTCTVQLTRENMAFAIGLQELRAPDGRACASWQAAPQLQLKDLLPGCSVQRMEWIES